MLSLKLLVPLLFVTLAFFLGWFSARLPTQTSGATLHAGLTTDRLTEVAELLVLNVEVTDVVVTSLQGRTGGVQIVLLVKGDVSLGIDVTAAQFRDVDSSARTAILDLPPPVASRPRLDHTRTRVVLMRKEGLWQLSLQTTPYAVAMDRAMADAQTLVNTAGTTADAEHRARSHAERVLQAFFKSMDWKVNVRWLKPVAKT